MIRRAILITLLMSTAAFADSAPQKLKLTGTTNYLKVTDGSEKVTLYGISEGNLSSTLQFGFSMPKGAKIKVEASYLDPKEDALKELSGTKEFFPIEIKEIEDIEKENKQCVEISAGEGEDLPEPEKKLKPEDYPEMSSPVCDAIPKKDREAIRQQMEATYGGVWSLGNVCGYLVSIALNPDFGGKDQWCALYDWFALLGLGINCFPDTFFATVEHSKRSAELKRRDFYGLLRKDACGPKNSRYLIRITINMKGVAPAIRQEGFSTIFRIKEDKKKTEMQASIKPVSEGRYAPRPLIMMNWLGTACGNSLTLTKWKKGLPESTTKLPIYSFLIYKNLILGLAVADKVLKGGQGTFELSNNRNAYGVCMTLQKKRQKVNGYP